MFLSRAFGSVLRSPTWLPPSSQSARGCRRFLLEESRKVTSVNFFLIKVMQDSSKQTDCPAKLIWMCVCRGRVWRNCREGSRGCEDRRESLPGEDGHIVKMQLHRVLPSRPADQCQPELPNPLHRSEFTYRSVSYSKISTWQWLEVEIHHYPA